MEFLRKLAFPISLVYALVVYLRNFFYDKGLFTSTSFKTPTVCIGNLSVGGTGKTPMIEYFLRLLADDVSVAVLSRGYRRKTRGFVLANERSTVADLGDEPFQIYSKFTSSMVVVDKDRRNGIRNIERIGKAELILLDDAFQHRKVNPSISILLTTYSNPYYKDWYLPTGDLRDSRKEARRARYIIVTKCPGTISMLEKQRIIASIKPKDHQKVLFSKLIYGNLLRGNTTEIPFKELNGKHFSLVTGIANPDPLVDYLRNSGNSFEHFKYPDHHFFREEDIAEFSKNKWIITTEKDFTKLKDSCKNVFYLEVRHEFLFNGENELRELVKEAMTGSRSCS